VAILPFADFFNAFSFKTPNQKASSVGGFFTFLIVFGVAKLSLSVDSIMRD
jgi:hypothetical protein